MSEIPMMTPILLNKKAMKLANRQTAKKKEGFFSLSAPKRIPFLYIARKLIE